MMTMMMMMMTMMMMAILALTLALTLCLSVSLSVTPITLLACSWSTTVVVPLWSLCAAGNSSSLSE
eukprot:2224823-Karenia_brevis.AAC.1